MIKIIIYILLYLFILKFTCKLLSLNDEKRNSSP